MTDCSRRCDHTLHGAHSRQCEGILDHAGPHHVQLTETQVETWVNLNAGAESSPFRRVATENLRLYIETQVQLDELKKEIGPLRERVSEIDRMAQASLKTLGYWVKIEADLATATARKFELEAEVAQLNAQLVEELELNERMLVEQLASWIETDTAPRKHIDALHLVALAHLIRAGEWHYTRHNQTMRGITGAEIHYTAKIVNNPADMPRIPETDGIRKP